MSIGSACRNKVLNTLRRKFKSPEEAEAHYFPLNLVASEPTEVEAATITPRLLNSSENQDLKVISSLYKSYCTSCSSVTPPDDFLKFALLAMEHLKSCGRSNVLYNLAKALGTMRDDQTDSLLPVKRMPMGLIEHCVNFFCCSHSEQVYVCTSITNSLTVIHLFLCRFLVLMIIVSGWFPCFRSLALSL